MKIPKTYTTGGKRKIHFLHKRIELFRNQNSEQADLLMAIKWIGNSGSHSRDSLTKDDMLDSFEILEHVTKSLYNKDADRIKKLTKKINKNKKPISANKSRKKNKRL